nr:sodium:proton antiporter [FCB group bacterium]
MPDLSIVLVFSIVILTMIAFISGKQRVDVIALTVLVILLLLRLIPFEKAMSGFANPATATVAAMFIISAGLVRTGLVQWLARQLDKISGKSELQLLIAICITIAVLSAFIVNTATVAIFIPIAIVLAKARKISSSRILMPLSFASQFGGVCTLIGTSTNILVNAIAIEKGMQPFGLFEF